MENPAAIGVDNNTGVFGIGTIRMEDRARKSEKTEKGKGERRKKVAAIPSPSLV